LEDFHFEPNWKKIKASLESASKSADKVQLFRTLQLVLHIFPETLNEKNISEIKPLISQVRILTETWTSGDISRTGKEVLAKWKKNYSESGLAKNAKFEKILKGNDLESESPAVFTSLQAKAKASKRK
jgi:hypothetical protein